MKKSIIIRGARQNNLKNIDVEIPRDKLVVFTGLSGSGKSSLAIDTIYAEGQRRYLESLNTYARQFLGSMDKPDLDYIEGLSPSIAIEQKAVSKNPRSTVGTVTEIYDYLRLLYANVGIPHCPKCGREIKPLTTQEIADDVFNKFKEKTKFRVLAPIVQRRKGTFAAVFQQLKKDGFSRVIVDEIEYTLDEEIALDKNKFHTIDVVIDRLIKKDTEDFHQRLSDSIEQASKLTKGLVKIWEVDKNPIIYSEQLYCPYDQLSVPEPKPQLFSFNTPEGLCQVCNGLGTTFVFTERKIFPKKNLSVYESNLREIGGFGSLNSYTWQILENVANHYNCDLNTPINELPKDFWNIFLYGSRDEKISFSIDSNDIGSTRDFYYSVRRSFEGILNMLQRRYLQTKSETSREYYERWMEEKVCRVCKGSKLRPEALAVTIREKNIAEFAALTVDNAIEFLKEIDKNLTDRQRHIVKDVIKELFSRYGFMKSVGLDYLTMDRPSRTLSGGESERVRLATQIGSNLVGVLYVLDEPSIGLHPRDKFKLINMLEQLRDKGNSVFVVEHDEDIIRAADFIVDIGPGAGVNGGHIISAAPLSKLLKHPTSLTAQYLRGDRFIPIPSKRRIPQVGWITIKGARQNNLKNVNVSFPIGLLTVVTGVSGAGKSSLVMEILYKGLYQKIHPMSNIKPGEFDEIIGSEFIDKIIHIDQQPIGRTPRSIPATYTKVFDHIRNLFEATQEAKLRGYKKGRFSFNVKGGRCERCQGSGYILIEMQFLPDVYIKCDVCDGKRFNKETLDVKFKGKNISEILEMSHEEALEFFANFPKIKSILQTVNDVGLGYIRLGQSSTTLSGGEAQRIKLSRELSKRSTGKTLYILDEPTTGLHFHDTLQLLNVIQRLVDQGNTVVIIEHNMDIIKSADYIIDMGPEGGDQGGYVVALGTPEKIAENPKSYTGKYLKEVLGKEKPRNNDHLDNNNKNNKNKANTNTNTNTKKRTNTKKKANIKKRTRSKKSSKASKKSLTNKKSNAKKKN